MALPYLFNAHGCNPVGDIKAQQGAINGRICRCLRPFGPFAHVHVYMLPSITSERSVRGCGNDWSPLPENYGNTISSVHWCWTIKIQDPRAAAWKCAGGGMNQFPLMIL